MPLAVAISTSMIYTCEMQFEYHLIKKGGDTMKPDIDKALDDYAKRSATAADVARELGLSYTQARYLIQARGYFRGKK